MMYFAAMGPCTLSRPVARNTIFRPRAVIFGAVAEALIIKQIEASRKLRIAKFKSGENMLIGINAYPNEFESPKAEWGEIPVAYGFPYLIFEKNAN